MQREVRDLEQRCQAAEARHQDLAANIPEATRPLLRQLEAMQVGNYPSLTSQGRKPTLPVCVLLLLKQSVAEGATMCVSPDLSLTVHARAAG